MPTNAVFAFFETASFLKVIAGEAQTIPITSQNRAIESDAQNAS